MSSTLTTSDFDYIRDVVRRQSAIVLEPGKEYLVESRLLPLARSSGEGSIAAIVTRMRREPTGPITAAVVDAMTTNETSFFRDNHPFDALQKHVLPELVKARAAERRLSFWCGASSSGQEPYTIAMVLKEALAGHPGFQSSLLATDLSAEMLARTKAAKYSQLEVNRGLPVTMLVKHFDKVGTEWQVKPELRATVQTRPLNLATPFPAMGPFDVVFLRNVLIYFDTPTKKAVLDRVRRVLRPDGYLFLGGAETTLTIDDAWERVVLDRATAYRPRT
ncbi:MAG: methyltransferase, CheR-type [Frankiales bacterium]|nr:methyltransferase, CheR-type [Frankiales bacterium]